MASLTFNRQPLIPTCLLRRFHPTAQLPVRHAECPRSMIKAIFRLTELEKQKIFKLREMGVRPPDIARRFGLSEGVVHKIIQAQRALLQSKIGPRGELLTSGFGKQEAS